MSPGFGTTGILRLAGAPIDLWLRGGSTQLFEQLRTQARVAAMHTESCTALAAAIGEQLIPLPELTREERRGLLQLRRRLHQAEMVSEAEQQLLVQTCQRVLGHASDIVVQLRRWVVLQRELVAATASLEESIPAERSRLLSAAFCTVTDSAVLSAAVSAAEPQVYADVVARVRRGTPWADKRLRQGLSYFWRLVARATVKSTPRGHFAHVALIPTTTEASGMEAITALDQFALDSSENLHTRRQNDGRESLGPRTQLSLTPLHWFDEDRFECWVTDPKDAAQLVHVSLRRSPTLEAIRTAIGYGTCSFAELELTLFPDAQPGRSSGLSSFIGYLAELGVVESRRDAPLADPRRCAWARGVFPAAANLPQETARSEPWPAPVEPCGATAGNAPTSSDHGYVDVYRSVDGGLTSRTTSDLQRRLLQTLRILKVLRTPPGPAHHMRDVLGERPRPLLAVMQQLSEHRYKFGRARAGTCDWSSAQPPAAHAQLVRWLSMRVEQGKPLDIDAALLDRLGFPSAQPEWPLDALLRVGSANEQAFAVLDQLFYAGIMDARFVTRLRELHGALPQEQAYRAFIEQLQRDTDLVLVEVLVPPLSARAANAVRRPLYTPAWTGDAALDLYCSDQRSRAHHVPLQEISLRWDGRLIAEASGRRLWPLYHATRTPQPPWNVLLELLLAAAPRPGQWALGSLQRSLGLLQSRDFMPRITIEEQLILAPAQWSIAAEELWSDQDSDLVKLRRLERLRSDFGLPRWVFVAAPHGHKPLPCDLESLHALKTVERLVQDGAQRLLVTEMVPAPHELLVGEALGAQRGGLVSELLLRLPGDEAPEAMARRVSKQLSDTIELRVADSRDAPAALEAPPSAPP
jgi:hypothetical protein